MAGKSSVTLKEINEMLSEHQVQGLEGISIQGDVEIEIEMNCGGDQLIAQSLGQELTKLALTLFDFSRSMGYPVKKI